MYSVLRHFSILLLHIILQRMIYLTQGISILGIFITNVSAVTDNIDYKITQNLRFLMS